MYILIPASLSAPAAEMEPLILFLTTWNHWL